MRVRHRDATIDLAQHDRRRARARPTATCLVVDEAFTSRAVELYARHVSPRIVVRSASEEIVVAAWRALDGGRSLVDALAGSDGAESLDNRLASATAFDRERILDAYRADGVPDAVLDVAFSSAPPANLDALLACLDAVPAVALAFFVEGPLERRLRDAASIAFGAPRVAVAVAVETADWSRYLETSPETRVKALLREGLVHLAAEPESREAREARLVRDILQEEDASLAKSAAEQLLYDRLEAQPETRGAFALNATIPARFGPRNAEIDLYAERLAVAVEVDGYFHFRDDEAFRRDRKKDVLLQKHGVFVVRVLATDVAERLDAVVASVIDVVHHVRRARGQP